MNGNPEDLNLTDSELITVLRNHGFDRRTIMKIMGVGAGFAVFGTGSAAAKHEDPHPPHIDSYYGYASPDGSEKLPGKLRPDHEVSLHVHEEAIFSPPPTEIPFHFDPMGLQIDVGDIVRFDFHSPEHTITAYHEDLGRQQRVPDGTKPFSSPVITGPTSESAPDSAEGFWLYEFDQEGVYDMFCAPHEPWGMVMRLVVGEPSGPNVKPTGRPPFSRAELTLIGVTEWPFPTPHAVFQTEALEVGNIDSSGVDVGDVESDLAEMPIVTKILPNEVSGTGDDAVFDVQWAAFDPDGTLDEISLVLTDLATSPPSVDDSVSGISIGGGTASGTTTLTAEDDNGEGHQYLVTAEVTDEDDNSYESTIPVTEDGAS